MRDFTAQILFSSQIPFAMGMSEIWGADCLGLVILQHKMDNLDYSWEYTIPRRPMSFQEYCYYLTQCGYTPDDQGDVIVLRYVGNAHLGLVHKDKMVSQDNRMGGTYVQNIPTNGFRFSKTKHKDS